MEEIAEELAFPPILVPDTDTLKKLAQLIDKWPRDKIHEQYLLTTLRNWARNYLE